VKLVYTSLLLLIAVFGGCRPGYTQITLSGDGAGGVSAGPQYYFSSSIGSDSNNCLTVQTPCQTISRANSLTYPNNATIAFLASDTFTLTSALTLQGANSGKTKNALGAVNVTSYGGSGICNVIAGSNAGCATFQVSGSLAGAIFVNSISDFTIQNIRLRGGTAAALGFETGYGIQYYNNKGTQSGVTIQNIETEDFSTGIYVQFNSGSLSNVSLLNNRVHGSTLASTDDKGIWVRFGASNVTVQGNLVENMGGHATGAYAGGSGNGILFADGVNGALDQFNVTRNSGANITTCGGSVGNWAYDSNNITIQFNESYGNQPSSYASGCDWDGFDLDAGVSNSVLQYNYSHGNYGSGYVAYMNAVGGHSWQNNAIRYNISENDSSSSNQGAVSFNGSPSSNSGVYNNTIYTHSTSAGSAIQAYCLNMFSTTTIVFANNICYNDNGNIFIYTNSTAAVLNGNDYYRTGTVPFASWVWGAGADRTLYSSFATYQSGSGQDANSVITNPSLSSAGSGGTCYSSDAPLGRQPCPGSYVLRLGSAMIGAGLNLTRAPYSLSVGTRDYYGNAIPHGVGSGYNIGGDGGNP
jgi:hypothetical protein